MNYLIFFTSSKMHFYDLTIKEVLFQVAHTTLTRNVISG